MGPTHCGWCHLWAGSPGSFKAWRISHEEQASQSAAPVPSVDFAKTPVSGFQACFTCFAVSYDDEQSRGSIDEISPFFPLLLIIMVFRHSNRNPKWGESGWYANELGCYGTINLSKAVCIDSSGKVFTQPMEGSKAIDVNQLTEGGEGRTVTRSPLTSTGAPYHPHSTSQ